MSCVHSTRAWERYLSANRLKCKQFLVQGAEVALNLVGMYKF